MPDMSVITAVISTTGTLCGALGGIALTSGLTSRREERQVQRQREDAHAAARREAYADLLGACTQMRVYIEITCQRHWKDMNIRLAAIQDHAVAVGLQASRTAVLSPGPVADCALALARAASGLSAWAASNADMGNYGGSGEQFIAGQVRGSPDFTQLDRQSAEFYRLASAPMGVS